MDPPDRDRRVVLKALACLVPTMGCARATLPDPAPIMGIASGSVPGAIVALGRQFLAAHPEEGDREALRRALGLHRAEPEATQIARIDDALRQDLETADVVELDGWQLTRTECRLYALAALT